nr:MAG TPA: hypothetical protein [Caudoviricetes sp.]
MVSATWNYGWLSYGYRALKMREKPSKWRSKATKC